MKISSTTIPFFYKFILFKNVIDDLVDIPTAEKI